MNKLKDFQIIQNLILIFIVNMLKLMTENWSKEGPKDERKIIRTLLVLKKTLGPFCINQLKLETGVDAHALDNTIIHILKRNSYYYLQPRRGSMSRQNARTWLLFALKVTRILSRDFWTNGIRFYLDGLSWTHKTNPCDQARSTTVMAWIKKFKYNTKGKKRAQELKWWNCL